MSGRGPRRRADRAPQGRSAASAGAGRSGDGAPRAARAKGGGRVPASQGSGAEGRAAPHIAFRVVTYNFLAGGSRRRGGHWSRLVEAFAPDVVLAQECRPPEDSPGEPFRLGPRDAVQWRTAGGGRWGSGVLVRSGGLVPIEVPDYAGWVVGGELSGVAGLAGRRVRVFSVHCPAGERGYVRTMHEILDRVAALRDGAELVVGGDFNVVAGYREPGDAIRMSRGERELLDRISEELGLVSCWQAAHPGRPLAQTLRWTGNRAAAYHCDGIFVPEPWRVRLASCEVAQGPQWERLSDHNPVVAEFTAPE